MHRWHAVAATLAAGALFIQPAIPSSQAAEQEAPTNTETAEQVLVLTTQLQETQNRLRAFEADNAALRRQNERITHSQTTLTQSLAEANAEAELFRRQFADLKLRMEALGLASVGADKNKEALEQRLLKSVRDLALERQQKDALAEHLAALSEAIFRYLKTAPGAGDPATRLDVEAEMRASSETLGGPSTRAVGNAGALPASLHDGMVVSVKEDWALVVANVGAKHGVKLGMPFKVVRGDTLIGRVRAIDVRESITGTAIESLSAKDAVIKVGDQLRVDTQF